MELFKVELVHSSGKSFTVNLTQYEINKAETDPEFYNNICEKYYSLHVKGLVTVRQDNSEFEEDPSTQETNDFLSEEPTESGNNNRFIWPRKAVLLLLDEMHQRKSQLLLPHKRKDLFTDVAKILQGKGFNVNWEVCDRKWRGLQSTYKKILCKEQSSGSGAITWEFYKQVEEIVEKDPSYNPVTTISAGVSQITQEVKRKKVSKEVDDQFKSVNDNIIRLDETINRLVDVQERRNTILERIAAGVENLSNG